MFKIVDYNDYHEENPPKGWKSIELGCFLKKDNKYCTYFFLYYKEELPKLESILQSLIRKISFKETRHFHTGNVISFSKEEVISLVTQRLNNGIPI